ncbi:helix-turn-helix domain-containing protein [Arthrobacter sp. I2-34]|uniref:Helix-turn-helix domain-containing protein n=1 Tax=Arthrobacter hankyongi TaxID=2904801 RepID=A0ABS9LCB7_9MICC|nr:helix-turn-helix domain-containing protein [Arthrobacter hankyongi]MCG2624334.1 helix-turn-helix domain-containing protein [Arthrobacter hankyongi]
METLQKQGFNDSVAVARWNQLLDRLSVDVLTDAFLDRVLQLEDYRDGALPASEIRRTGAASFQALIESLRPGTDNNRLLAERQNIALEVGVSRARAGIPVESLMTAIRLDFTVLWSELIGLAGPEDAVLLVHRAETVWQVVDSYAAQTQVTYMAERQRMAHEASSVRQGYVAAIFGPATPAPALVERIAGELGLDRTAPLGVAVAAAEDAAALRVVVAQAARRGAEVFTHPLPDALVAFWTLDERAGSPLHEAADRISRLHCGQVERVDGLDGLWEAARIARDLAQLVQPADGGALTLGRAWPRIARLRLTAAGLPIAPEVDTALAGCGRVERERLMEAVQSYLSTGSIAESAARLYCHRNTLMNRLRRFTELTGMDPTVPAQAARLVVAWN